MSNKYEVRNFADMYLGFITKYRAEKAIFYGIAQRSKNINHKAIYTGCFSMDEFEYMYEECKKQNKNIKTECWECGEEVLVNSKSKRPYCKECEERLKIERERDTEIYSRLRAKFMLERAFKILEKQEKFIQIQDYKEAGEVIQEYIEINYSKFGSAHEMVAAMELLRNKIHIKIQPTIANRRADFMLKEEKIILEIDGYLHEHSKEDDFKFDIEVRKELGAEWEIIRIPTKYIEHNVTMLYEAVMELKAYEQKLRKQNNGLLPDYYSKREKEVWGKLG